VTEKVKESISALVDEEISEIEVHRLLRQYPNDDELRTTFVSYQQIRAIIKQENYLSHAQHVVLHTNILAAIELEEAPVLSSEMASASASRSVQNRARRKTLMMFPERMKLPAAGFAVAASIVVAVFVGFNVVDNPANVASQDSAGVLATQSLMRVGQGRWTRNRFQTKSLCRRVRDQIYNQNLLKITTASANCESLIQISSVNCDNT